MSDLSHIAAIFVDDGGVMNDNTVRGEQYRKYLGDYLAPRLGGTPEQWDAANRAAFTMEAFEKIPAGRGYKQARRNIDRDWLRIMCEHVGVDAPADDEECADFADETSSWVWAQIRAEIPGAVEAVRRLHSMGYRIYAGSGTDSTDLAASYEVTGIRHLYTELYGSDIVDMFKNGCHFHQAILAHSGVSPSTTLFIDDSNEMVTCAKKAGAQAVLVTSEPPEETDAVAVIGSLAELPELLPGR